MQKRGFTLIEILVGLTIIGILFGFGYASFRDFSRREALSSAGKLIEGDLRLTQSMALAGQKPPGNFCTTPNTLVGYQFNITSVSSYTIDANCTGSVSPINIKTVEITTASLSPPIPNPIEFKVLGMGTNIPEGTDATIILTQTGSNSTLTITISSGGQIK